jgi:dienelactone hydrolase
LREVQPGKLQGEVQLADHQNLSLPVQQITYQHPRLTVRWTTGTTTDFTINFTREGDFLKGKFTADSAEADILLVRRGEAEPLPYREQPIRFKNGSNALAGTLLMPDDTLQVHPAVVMLQNAPQRSSLSMQILTDLLARRGVVVLLMAGRPSTATTSGSPDSLATDVLAAAQALRRVAGVDSTQIGLVGSGAGATALALAANKDDKKNSVINFVVALGAPGSSNAAREAEQVTRALRKQRASAADQRLVALTRSQLEQYMRRDGRGDTMKLHRNLRKIAPQPWAAHTGLPTRVPSRAELESPQWRELAFDPRTVWEQVRVPVLLLYGGADTTLNVQASASRLRGSAGQRRGSLVRVYAGADQDLLLPAGKQDEKWQWPRPVPGYVDEITAWLRERIE